MMGDGCGGGAGGGGARTRGLSELNLSPRHGPAAGGGGGGDVGALEALDPRVPLPRFVPRREAIGGAGELSPELAPASAAPAAASAPPPRRRGSGADDDDESLDGGDDEPHDAAALPFDADI